MNKKIKSVKSKVIIGYILLFLVGVVSIVFLYNEILKANKPKDEISIKNQQLLDLSDALSTLYQAESTGRNTDFIISASGFSRYNQIIDSAIYRMKKIRLQENSTHKPKLDSITLLLNKKKTSMAKIRVLNHQYNNEVSFANAQKKLEEIRDSLRNSQILNYPKSIRSREFENMISEFLTKEQVDNFNRLPVSDSDLLAHYDKILTELFIQEDKLKSELQEKERDLQAENQILSNKIQILVSSIEKEIRDDSITEMSQNREDLERTTLILLWFGVIGVLLLLLFGWIILRDLTRQQKYRDKLEELNHDNTMLLRSKTMLLATVTHDMQTPLGSILGFSDLLKKTSLNITQKQYINNISSSTDYILNLVNDLVDFSKLERNKIKIDKIAFNPKELIQNTFYTLKQNAIDKDILLLYEVEEDLDINVVSDPYRIKQVLTNLVTNAIKFTPEGYVKIIGKIENNNLILQVKDTGIGISKEGLNLIFEEFTQATPDIEKQFGGTGLGLTISKRVTELLGGTLHAKSELGVGSTFSLSIPLIISDDSNIKEEIKEYSIEFLQGKRILIIDDDKMQLSLMKAVFENYPIELVTENDATKVVSLLEKTNFDLIFTDIQMPKKSGFVLIQKIRNHKNVNIQELPVVALSGQRDLSLEDFTEKGFNYFIGKPMIMEEVLQIMDFIFNEKENSIILQSKTSEISNKLYDLTSLKQFIAEDEEALQNIITIFLESTQANIKELQSHIGNLEELSTIAHKMIPMLKQIESFEVVLLLEKLEDKEISLDKTKGCVTKIIKKLNILTQKLQTDFN